MFKRLFNYYCRVKLVSKSNKGQAMTEYGLLIALIALVVIIVIAAIGTRLFGVFEDIRDALPT